MNPLIAGPFINQHKLGSQTTKVNLPYYDPSYGLTYQDEEEFDSEAMFGYFSDFAKGDDPPEWWVRRPEDQISERNILFHPNREGYPLCGSDPQLQ